LPNSAVTAAARLLNCPNCQASFAPGQGTIAVCPRCGERVLAPPQEELFEKPAAEPVKAAASDVASMTVICKLCDSRYYARPAQIGQVLPCPDCHTANLVTQPEEKQAAAVPETLSDEDDFKLSDPVDTPEYRALAADSREFERAIRSQRGLASMPPRVGSPRPPASEPPPASRPATPGERTGSAPQQQTAAPSSASKPAPTPSVKPSTKPPSNPSTPVSPDDIELFPEDDLPPAAASPTPAPTSAAPARPANDDDEPIDLTEEYHAPQPYRAADSHRPAETPYVPPASELGDRASPPPMWMPKPDDDDDGSDFSKSVSRLFASGPGTASLPPELLNRRPFGTGVFSVLLQPQVMGRWIVLSLIFVVEILALAVIVNLASEGGVAQIGALLIYLAAYIPGIAATAAMAVFCMTVLQDTANGQDRIESWPEFSFLDWIANLWYLVAAFFVAGLPGALFTTLFTTLGLPVIVTPIFFFPSLFVFFPPVLISMLEAGTVTEPISKPMLRSFAPLGKFWAIFYGLSMTLGMAWVVMIVLSMMHWVATLLFAFALTAIPILYFRLLGRMALMYRDFVLATTPDDEEETEYL
jgi:DNA-directed RNA polymerase subunit RPC12/RpoP